jgi:hypothetical protein
MCTPPQCLALQRNTRTRNSQYPSVPRTSYYPFPMLTVNCPDLAHQSCGWSSHAKYAALHDVPITRCTRKKTDPFSSDRVHRLASPTTRETFILERCTRISVSTIRTRCVPPISRESSQHKTGNTAAGLFTTYLRFVWIFPTYRSV